MDKALKLFFSLLFVNFGILGIASIDVSEFSISTTLIGYTIGISLIFTTPYYFVNKKYTQPANYKKTIISSIISFIIGAYISHFNNFTYHSSNIIINNTPILNGEEEISSIISLYFATIISISSLLNVMLNFIKIRKHKKEA
ncbi:hypothetical protein V6R21_08925 [Limibacter armeniacum]|uniref:hypothetical protein n=1 Tax=Limibacter armeniacum TaxID=466084 RepID=UPI002FE51DC3